MDDGVQAQPGEEPNERKGPTCEQGGDMTGTGLWALFDQCSAEDQQRALLLDDCWLRGRCS